MDTLKNLQTEIRKIRKKLRQIEYLENNEKDLSPQEVAKVQKKTFLRSDLRVLLARRQEVFDQAGKDHSPTTSSDQSPSKYFGNGLDGESQPSVSNFVEESYSEGPQFSEDEQITGVYETPEGHPQLSEDENSEQESDNSHSQSFSVNKASNNEKLEKDDKEVKKNIKRSIQESRNDGDTGHYEQPESNLPLKKSKTSEKGKLDPLSQKWHKMAFDVTALEGHNDMVCSIATDGHVAVTGSRDTMVKVWSLQNCAEMKSFGGHTDTVTSVLLLSEQQAAPICRYYGDTGGQLCISGSSDCSIKIWHLQSGQMVKSIYTYNPVTCLQYVNTLDLLLSGTGGGKLELWNLKSCNCVQSVMAHEDSLSALQVDGNFVYSSSNDGVIKVFEIRSTNLHPIFVSENIKVEGSPSATIIWRQIRCLAAVSQNIYFGDDGMNVKVLNWKKGSLRKLNNHLTEFGVTDAVSVHDNLLLCSGYDLDNGIGYVNVRNIANDKYMATITDDDTPRIVCLACGQSDDGKLRLLTGGFDLKLWQELDSSDIASSDDVIHARFITKYRGKARHSDIDSDVDFSDSDLEDGRQAENVRRLSIASDTPTGSWLSWCSIL